MQIDRPVFIIGPPRSGTSLLYRLLATHPDVGYITRGAKNHPERPRLAWALTRLGRFDDHPKEGNPIWNRFQQVPEDLMDAEDAPPEVVEWFRRFTGGLLEARGVTRFLAKCPRHAVRLGWLDAVYPDCRFVVIQRDWRAVVASTVRKRERDTEKGKRWWGVHVPGWRQLRREGPEVGAAGQYAWVHDYLDRMEPRYGDRMVRLWYEELCADTEGTLRRILDHCGLRWTDEFGRGLPTDLEARNDKWREVLDESLVAGIRERFEEVLPRCEWPPEDGDAAAT